MCITSSLSSVLSGTFQQAVPSVLPEKASVKEGYPHIYIPYYLRLLNSFFS